MNMKTAKRLAYYGLAFAIMFWAVMLIWARFQRPELTETQILIEYWYVVVTELVLAAIFVFVARSPDD